MNKHLTVPVYKICLLFIWLIAPELGALTILPRGERLPDFAASPNATYFSGSWGRTASTDDVLINGPVTISGAKVADEVRIASGGTLTFDPNADTELTVTTVYCAPGGALMMTPSRASVTHDMIFRDQAIDRPFDPDTIGNGFVAHGCTVTITGADKTDFVRLAEAPDAGDTTLELESAPTGWNAGDLLYLPDSRMTITVDLLRNACAGQNPCTLPYHYDFPTLASVSGATATLTARLKHDHPASLNGGAYKPHVANLTRNVTFRSENPSGTRGHVMIIDNAVAHIKHAAFVDLGRTTTALTKSTFYNAQGNPSVFGTNQEGRYSLHFHHNRGMAGGDPSGYQFSAVGNVVYNSLINGNQIPPLRWGMVFHGATNFGLVQDNVTVGIAGAGMVTESGAEHDNIFHHNFSSLAFGRGGPVYELQNHGNNNVNVGNGGHCYWFSGADNAITDNVATNCHFGLVVFHLTTNTPYAVNPGEAPSTSIIPFTQALSTYSGNEYYGPQSDVHSSGLNFWGLCSRVTPNESQPLLTCEDSLAEDSVIWSANKLGVQIRLTNKLKLVDFHIIGDPSFALRPVRAIDYDKRVSANSVVENVEIDGYRYGIFAPNVTAQYGASNGGRFDVIGGSIDCFPYPIFIPTLYGADQVNGLSSPISQHVPKRQIFITDVNITVTGGTPIYKDWEPTGQHKNPVQLDQTYVVNLNGNGKIYQVYYVQQLAAQIVPQRQTNMSMSNWGAPVPGLTNTQALATYGIVNGGETAPADAVQMTSIANNNTRVKELASLP